MPIRQYISVGSGGGGAQHGEVAMSALGSGCACLTAFIAHCPVQSLLDPGPQSNAPGITGPERKADPKPDAQQ